VWRVRAGLGASAIDFLTAWFQRLYACVFRDPYTIRTINKFIYTVLNPLCYIFRGARLEISIISIHTVYIYCHKEKGLEMCAYVVFDDRK
jgi:hypothetical protein